MTADFTAAVDFLIIKAKQDILNSLPLIPLSASEKPHSLTSMYLFIQWKDKFCL